MRDMDNGERLPDAREFAARLRAAAQAVEITSPSELWRAVAAAHPNERVMTPEAVRSYWEGGYIPRKRNLRMLARVVKISAKRLEWGDSQESEKERGHNLGASVAPLTHTSEVSVPLLPWEYVLLQPLPPADYPKVSVEVPVGPRAFALTVLDDTMVNIHQIPTFPKGCQIIVDPDRPSDPASFIIAMSDGWDSPIFTQLKTIGGKRYLAPLNPRYPAEPAPDDLRIIGVVVAWSIRGVLV